ncbi:MAG: DegT/DnrJ/EryC1/StrS family aminotransferase [Alphaproteobacteria bacterium]
MLPAILGGTPRCASPLEIVRPVMPPLEAFAAPFSEALAHGQLTNNGPFVQRFEAALSEYLNVPAIVFSSGQAALMAMLAAADIAGGEVIVPSYTFAATPHAVVWAGAQPVFADILPDSMTLDVDDVARRITPRTKAILPMCSYGIACDYAALDALGVRHGLPVLYDSAPAFGSRVNGKPVGGAGRGQIFSFHATKAFSTMEGGALSSHDDELLNRARMLRNFGQHNGPDCPWPGFNGKMMEVCAMIGLLQLERFESIRRRRLAVAAAYHAALSDLPGVRFLIPPAGQEPIWLYYPLVFDAELFGLDRDEVARALAAEGIAARKYFELPCHHMTCYQPHHKQSLPVTESIAAHVISLPVYGDQTDAEIAAITGAIRGFHEYAAQLRMKLQEK